MKYKLLIGIIAIILTSNSITGQHRTDQIAFSSSSIQRDSLIIERRDEQKVKLIWSYTKNIKKQVAWAKLLEDFQSDFTKVVEDIPDYKFYNIKYIQKQNLVVDEMTGRETYTVNENDGLNYIKSNIAKLHGKKIKIIIEFSDKNELLDPSLKAEIEAAISLIKNKFYISTVSPERHFYSVESASILPNPKPKFKFYFPMGARLGLLKNKPYMELRPGLGLIQDKQYYFALNWNLMTQYNSFSDQTEFDSYVGLTVGSLGAGFGSEVAFQVKNGITNNESIFFRGGINYRTSSGIQIGLDYYLREPRDDVNIGKDLLFGFHLGFGF